MAEMHSTIITDTLESINLKDKLTDEDITKLGFCLLSELLSIHEKIDELCSHLNPSEKRFVLADHILKMLEIDTMEVQEFGFVEFGKRGVGPNVHEEDFWKK